MAAANAQIGVARAAYFPDLTLTGSYGFAASGLGSLFDASNSLWSYGLAAAETLETQDRPNGSGSDAPRHTIAIAALRMHAERMHLGKRERRLAEHFTSAHPAIPVAEVGAQPEDVHDLDGLRVIGATLSRQAP